MRSHKMMGTALLISLSLAGCGTANYVGVSDTTGATMDGRGQVLPSAYGPITTYPIVTTQKVPQGTTPTGSTGYAMANSARSNATIVDGTAATCGPENAGGNYDIACAQAAGLPSAAYPYRN
ncbi:hypothetical protein C8J27_103371 [Rhodobacter aestuarii]|uniref:Lipoprotein n=1 Tax=Rhodobacter aestuarii TaxID=453582 RepID=A0A1N7JPX7_9RHOB|nr:MULTISPECIES: hypothetical protein [Rhodobacter]PTV96039.1 hypothetical protein C8J27_103371 [Rhodobacter aestuarii]SIS51357.1 hypothetical protein SAMN05421580_10264 [Rhodobacter aestuarii]SOC10074.1 hypothetical protein SAMN05877809_10562 [Rhodobacter sp. JA431]